MLRGIHFLSFLLLVQLATVSPAGAISVGGENYERFFSFETPNSLIYWLGENKFFPSESGEWNAPIKGETTFLASQLAGYDVAEFYTMGKSKYALGPTASQVLSLQDDAGKDLLTATLKGTGNLDLVLSPTTFGHFNLTGLFDVTGGLFAANQLVTGTIYAEIFFSTFYDYVGSDFRAKNGTINLYWKSAGPGPGPGPNPIPEPTTISLLAAGALGAGLRKFRRRVAAS